MYPPLGESDSRYSDRKKDGSSSASKFLNKVAKICPLYWWGWGIHTYEYQVWQRGCGNDENVNGVQSLSSCLIKSIRWCRRRVPRDIPILPPAIQCISDTRWTPVVFPYYFHTYIMVESPDILILPPAVFHQCRDILILRTCTFTSIL